MFKLEVKGGFMKFNYRLMSLVLLASAQFAVAANPRVRGSQFQTDENGFAKAPAEFSGFTITATTHCDATATSAGQSIRALSSKIENILSKFADPTVEEGIQVFPGATTQEELSQYVNGQSVPVCKGWRANQSYFFKLTKIDDIPVFQDAILELNPANDPRAQVELSAPKPGIFSKTYENLVDLALKDAHQKAIRRAKVLLSDMPQFSEIKLNQVTSSLRPAGSVAYDQTGLGGDPSLAALKSVTVSISRSFQFNLR